MMNTRTNGWLLCGSLLAAAVAGCVPSKHPLSDAAGSKVDERLLGTWEMDGERFLVRRGAAENTLEALPAEGGEEGQSTVLYATELGGRHYISLEDDESKPDARSYDIVRYELTDSDTLKVYFLDPKAIAKAVQADELAGDVQIRKERKQGLGQGILIGAILEGLIGGDPDAAPAAETPPATVESLHVTLSADPESLARYLEAHGAKCFSDDADEVLVYRRVADGSAS
jgi:hypothetical protein